MKSVKNQHPVYDITALYENHTKRNCHLVIAKLPNDDDIRQCDEISIYCVFHEVTIISVVD